MRKLLLILGALVALASPLALLPQPAYAAEFNSQVEECDSLPDSEFCNNRETDKNTLFGPEGIMTKIITFLNIVVGAVAVFMIIIAGIRLINSSGDPQKVATSKNTIIYGAVGIVIAASSQFIVAFVVTKL